MPRKCSRPCPFQRPRLFQLSCLFQHFYSFWESVKTFVQRALASGGARAGSRGRAGPCSALFPAGEAPPRGFFAPRGSWRSRKLNFPRGGKPCFLWVFFFFFWGGGGRGLSPAGIFVAFPRGKMPGLPALASKAGRGGAPSPRRPGGLEGRLEALGHLCAQGGFEARAGGPALGPAESRPANETPTEKKTSPTEKRFFLRREKAFSQKRKGFFSEEKRFFLRRGFFLRLTKTNPMLPGLPARAPRYRIRIAPRQSAGRSFGSF